MPAAAEPLSRAEAGSRAATRKGAPGAPGNGSRPAEPRSPPGAGGRAGPWGSRVWVPLPPPGTRTGSRRYRGQGVDPEASSPRQPEEPEPPARTQRKRSRRPSPPEETPPQPSAATAGRAGLRGCAAGTAPTLSGGRSGKGRSGTGRRRPGLVPVSGVGGGGRTGAQQSLGGSGEAETLSADLAAHRLQRLRRHGVSSNHQPRQQGHHTHDDVKRCYGNR
ncbi:uncharacterized protein [Canis lupus baileyi]|uniref:uncharacterized protein n=1 Tax=Canis lupus baileyi TaxID=143281 RepID=UPI003B97A1F6